MADTEGSDLPRKLSFAQAFSLAAQWTALQSGRASTFAFACATVVIWAATGPAFHYSDTWQLVINTGTTIVTFLMVFLIQNTQNRDMTMLHLKLDELIRANETARNKLLAIEDLTEEELARLKGAFTNLAANDSGKELLREVADDLSAAEKDIVAAREKVEQAGEST